MPTVNKYVIYGLIAKKRAIVPSVGAQGFAPGLFCLGEEEFKTDKILKETV